MCSHDAPVHQDLLDEDTVTDKRCTACTKADGADMLPCVDEAEQSDMGQSWPGLFWLPPADNGRDPRDMLHLDEELAGLVEAADTPADQDRTHSTKPEAASSVAGGGALAYSTLLLLGPSVISAKLPCASLSVLLNCKMLLLLCAVMCCAVLCHAMLCCIMQQ